MGEGEPRRVQPSTRWQSRVRDDAAFASTSRAGRQATEVDQLCLVTFDGDVEMWGMGRDEVRSRAKVPNARAVASLPGGCAALSDDSVYLLDDGGRVTTVVARGARALGVDRDSLWVATGDRVLDFGAGDGGGKTLRTARGVTMAARDRRTMVLGYEDGSVAQQDAPGDELSVFEDTPASPVTLLRFGPQFTVVVGFANGAVGIWNRATGRRVHMQQMHGPVLHAVVTDRATHLASGLGDTLSWDLSPLRMPYCEVLHDVWEGVPVTWQSGRAVNAPPPARHECARTGE